MDRDLQHDLLTLRMFEPLQGAQFFVHGDGELEPALKLDLVAVDRLPQSGIGERAESFSLVFTGAVKDGLLSQGMYALRHEHLGETQMFLVPIGPDKDGLLMRYEAIFT